MIHFQRHFGHLFTTSSPGGPETAKRGVTASVNAIPSATGAAGTKILPGMRLLRTLLGRRDGVAAAANG